MSDSRAYTYEINPNSDGEDEHGSVNQTSPSWILTFVSWQFRDTLRTNFANGASSSNGDLGALKAVNPPMVVRNDCVELSVTSSKGSQTPNFEAVLVQTDINYLTAIAPGDFVTINMLNWEADAERVALNSASQKPINGIKDGFKGIFKVQSVRRSVIVNPQTGAKTVAFRITGFAFTEFNNTIYFDPSVVQQFEGDVIFAKRLAENWYKLINDNSAVPIQRLIKILSETFIGQGVSSAKSALKSHDSQNVGFFMPAVIGKLLGIDDVIAAKDIYNFVMGIQSYANVNANSAFTGLNPSELTNTSGRTWETDTVCPGVSLLKGEYWNQVKTWDILNQYVNRPINEFYTCFRVAPDKDSVLPTVVLRQTPFTTEDFAKGPNAALKNTRFLTLPRWKIDPALVISEDIGRDEAARINYVQVFGKVLQGTDTGSDFTMESVLGNYVYEKNDIQRSGLKPTVISSTFDIYPGKGKSYLSVGWAKILGDALIGLHLRLNGTVVCVGIVDPIPVGDNFEYNNIVYHLEQVSHSCSIDRASGIKIFRTMVSLSQGVSVTSGNGGVVYGQMNNTNAYKERKDDAKLNQILPGVSESQNIPIRDGLDQAAPLDSPNKSFPQPREITVFASKTKKNK
jgi:hypothetical protein